MISYMLMLAVGLR